MRESLDPTLSVLETLTEGPPGRVVPVQVREPDLALPLEPERPHRGRRRRRAQAKSPVQDAGAREMVALTPVWCLPSVCANVVTWFPDSGLQEPEAEAQVQRPPQRRRFESVYPLSVTDYARAMNEMDRKMGYGTAEDRVLNAGRSGLASTSALHGNWPCPNPQCVNSRRLVFAKKTCCPLCKSERPVEVLDPRQERLSRETATSSPLLSGDSHVRLERVSRETAAVSPRLSDASHSRLEARYHFFSVV